MLQRIQTLYLFGIVICMIVLFFIPVLNIDVTSQITGNYYLFDNVDSLNFIPDYLQHTLLILVADILVLSLIIIFCYKKRSLQIKLCFLNAVFILLFYACIVYFRVIINQNQSVIHLHAGAVLPVIAFIFNYLAVYFIKKDEALIKSMDRIR
ncbi:MAG: DUF4293 domain-containing protein [Candidatus Azobacteroides sp.]|nr:DUF4293 domain-containing protein [Candidatus Azobacteroides sp.]